MNLLGRKTPISEQQQAEMFQSLQVMEQQLGISIDSHKK
jgi:hypothetical protein